MNDLFRLAPGALLILLVIYSHCPRM